MGNTSLLVLLVSLVVVGAVEKQIRLEDIERDNLNSAKQRQQASSSPQAPQSQPVYTFVAREQAQSPSPSVYAFLSREQQQQLQQAYEALPREQVVYQQQHQPQQTAQISSEHLAYLQQQQQQSQPEPQPQAHQPQTVYVPQGNSFLAVPQTSFLSSLQPHIQQHVQQQLQQLQPQYFQPQYVQVSAQPHKTAAARPAQYQLPVGGVVYSQPEAPSPKQLAGYSVSPQQHRQHQLDQQFIYQQLAQQYQQQQQQQQQQHYQPQPQAPSDDQAGQYNPYNALQQQSSKTVYASGVKSTPAPPSKPVSSGGFVPSSTLTSSTFHHPNQGVSYSHYRRGRGGF